MPDDLQIVMKSSEILKKEDFIRAFKGVLERVVSIQESQQKAIDRLEETYKGLIERIQKDHSLSLSELKKGVNELFVAGKLSEMDSKTRKNFESLEKKIDSLFSKKSKDLDYKVSSIKPIRGEPGPSGSPDTAEMIRAKLKLLGKPFKLEDIDGFEEYKQETDGRFHKRVISSPHNLVQYYDLSSSLDGSTKTFTGLPNFRHAVMLIGTDHPIIYRPTTDFTVGRGSIALTSEVNAPASGQTLILLYIK